MRNVCYGAFPYLIHLVTKIADHYVTNLDTRTKFRVQNICYIIIPDKQIL
jgi:hypothetical protein